jgi:hypothetical protein
MLDLLDNLPRLRLSDDHLKAIIWVMRECGTPNVPTFSRLRKLQAKLTRDAKLDTVEHTSSLGNRFYLNHPSQLFALVRALKHAHDILIVMISRILRILSFVNTYMFTQTNRRRYQIPGKRRNGSKT